MLSLSHQSVKPLVSKICAPHRPSSGLHIAAPSCCSRTLTLHFTDRGGTCTVSQSGLKINIPELQCQYNSVVKVHIIKRIYIYTLGVGFKRMQTWKSCDLTAHIHSAGFSHTISSSFQEVEVTMLGKVIGQHVEQEERQSQNSNHMGCGILTQNCGLSSKSGFPILLRHNQICKDLRQFKVPGARCASQRTVFHLKFL